VPYVGSIRLKSLKNEQVIVVALAIKAVEAETFNTSLYGNTLNGANRSSEVSLPDNLGLGSVAQGGHKGSEPEVSFSNYSENYCVSLVDIVGSTTIVSTIQNSEKIRMFYSIFINAMASNLKKYNGRIIKTLGDGVISYFPRTADTTDVRAFEEVVECCFAQIAKCPAINSTLLKEGLPTIGYRISADYGRVEIAKSSASNIEDLFGSTINFCSKINSQASPNGIVIGNDLYRIIKSFSHFEKNCRFEELRSYNFGVGKYSYPLYSLSRKIKPFAIDAVSSLSQNIEESRKYRRKAAKKSPRNTNILLIDDERDDLFVLEKFLTLEGFGVKSFSSSREALNHFAETSPSFYDLIISDIRMPEINGLELYLKLKAIKSDVRVLFATCIELAEEILSVMPGVRHDQLIKKPIEQKAFIEIVRKNIHNNW
jgi:two-component system, OmpR family, response regulator ChvI